jgi:hypothetical protein
MSKKNGSTNNMKETILIMDSKLALTKQVNF